MMKTTIALGVPLFLGLAACMPAQTPPDAPDRVEGAAFFAENCVQCHGLKAQGAGAAAKDLRPQPRDLTLLARNNGGRFPQTKTLAYIYGDPAGDAFAFLTVREAGNAEPVFRGWMIASSPALNAMDHQRYDVWVLSCTTS